MTANRNGVDTHLDDRIIIAARLSHIAEVEDFWFFDLEFFHEVGHAENLVHARSYSVNGSGAADFVLEFWCNLFNASNDSFALFVIWVPGVLNIGAGFLAKCGEGDLREAVFDVFKA